MIKFSNATFLKKDSSFFVNNAFYSRKGNIVFSKCVMNTKQTLTEKSWKK